MTITPAIEWDLGLAGLKEAGIPVHFIPEKVNDKHGFIIGASCIQSESLLCQEPVRDMIWERYYTNNPEIVTCQKCLEWLHA